MAASETEACKVVLRGWTASGLPSAEGKGEGRDDARVVVRVQLAPWMTLEETESTRMSAANGDRGPPGRHAEWDLDEPANRLQFEYPGWEAGRAGAAPHFIISVVEQRRRDHVVATATTSIFSLLAILQEEENYAPVSISLEPSGTLDFTLSAIKPPIMSRAEVDAHVPVLALARPEESKQASLSEPCEIRPRRARRPSAVKSASLGELMDKLRRRYENAKRGILGDRPFASAFWSFDAARSGDVSRPDFVKGLHKLEIRLTVNEMGVLMDMLPEASSAETGRDKRDVRVRYADLEDLILRHMAQDKMPVSPTGEILRVGEDVRAKLRALVAKARASGLSVERTFAHFDKLQSGSISKHDFQLGLEQLGFTLSVRELVALMTELDQDGNGLVSLEEFRRFVKGASPTSRTRPRVRGLDEQRGQDFGGEGDKRLRKISALGDEEERAKETSNAEDKVKTNQRLREPPGRHVQKLMTDNKELRAALEKCKTRIATLESRCARAESQSHNTVRRIRRKIAAEERARTQQEFVDLVWSTIEANFDKESTVDDDASDSDGDDALESREEKRCAEALQEQAHLAFEQVLEGQIADLRRAHKTQARMLTNAESRVAEADLRARRLEAFVFSRRELWAPNIASLSARVTHVVRGFTSKVVHAGLKSCARLFGDQAWGSLERLQTLVAPLVLSRADMAAMARELGAEGLGWSEGDILGDAEGTRYHFKALATALDRCHAWDMQSLLEEPALALPEPRPPGAPISIAELPVRFADILRAALASLERTGHGAVDWFSDIPIPDWATLQTLALDLDQLNDDLAFAHAPCFQDAADLESALTWLRDYWPHVDGIGLHEQWKQQGTVFVYEFARAIDTLCADMRIQQELESLRLQARFPASKSSVQKPFKEQKASEGANLAAHAFQAHHLLSRFSTREHSSCWPPLSKFGREPYDCVRLVNDRATVEHVSSKARNVLAFVEGALERGERNAVILQMNKEVSGTNGVWGLCVTTEGAANRPVRGAAVYLHSGEARVEGVSLEGKEYPVLITNLEEDAEMLEENAIVCTSVLHDALEQGGCGDEEILTALYKRLLPSRSLAEIVTKSSTLVEAFVQKQQDSDLARQDILLWKARELECRMRLQCAEEALRALNVDRWSIEAEYKESMATGRRSEGSFAAGRLFHGFKDMLPAHEWHSLIKAARGESASLDDFTTKMAGFQNSLREILRLSDRQLAAFNANVQRLINKRQHVQHSHFSAVRYGDRVAATVDNEQGTVAFFVNGVFQTSLTPVCSQPLRFAWFTNRAGSASIVQTSS